MYTGCERKVIRMYTEGVLYVHIKSLSAFLESFNSGLYRVDQIEEIIVYCEVESGFDSCQDNIRIFTWKKWELTR